MNALTNCSDWDLSTVDGSRAFQAFVTSSSEISQGVITKTLVASRNGPYRIRMGARTLAMELRTAQQVQYLLSYTWDGIESTPIGDIAGSTFEAAADALILVDHVWIDLLAHANGPQKAKLIDSMGPWYARKDIRVIVDGLYDHSCPNSVARFERSFSRGWIYQETSYTRIYNDGLNMERAVKLGRMRLGRDTSSWLGSTIDEQVARSMQLVSKDTLDKACLRVLGVVPTQEELLGFGIKFYTDADQGGTVSKEAMPAWFMFSICEFDTPSITTRESLASLLAASKRDFHVESDRYIALTSVLASINGVQAAHTADECSRLVCGLFCKMLKEPDNVRITVKGVGPGFCNVLGLSVDGRLTIPPTKLSPDTRQGDENSYDIILEGDAVKATYVDGAGTSMYFETTRAVLYAEATRNLGAAGFDYAGVGRAAAVPPPAP